MELLDPYDTSQVVATGTSDSTGMALLPGVTAGPYLLQVSAPGHQTVQESYTVEPGMTNTAEVFLTNELVTYTWVVVPTEVQDQYTVQLQTTFATDVPAPVVTLSAPQSLPTLEPCQTAQINLTVTNHGLIAAEDMQITPCRHRSPVCIRPALGRRARRLMSAMSLPTARSRFR